MVSFGNEHKASLSLITLGPAQVAMFSFEEVSPWLRQHRPNGHTQTRKQRGLGSAGCQICALKCDPCRILPVQAYRNAHLHVT